MALGIEWEVGVVMQFNIELKMKTTDEIVRVHGLGENGDVQKFIDAECIRYMDKYTPMITGTMIDSAITGTVIGSGLIEYANPYARFQYYGKVMTTEDGRVWAKKDEEKPIITGRNLVHNKSRHPQAGPFWFERMKADYKETILEGAQKIARGGK